MTTTVTESTTLQLQSLIQLRSQARKIELGSHRLALSAQLGGYRSSYRGRGLEFDEVRPYQAGDDIRTIGWRVTARRGKVHTKLFREERERPILLLIDLHPGMYFGSRVQFKSVLAGKLAAVIGWAAIHSGDRVGGVVTAAEGERFVPLASRESALLKLLKASIELQPNRPGTPQYGGMDRAIQQLVQLAHPGSLIFLISDFQQLSTASDAALQQLSRHNDLIFSFLYDPLEQTPPTTGHYPVTNHLTQWQFNSRDKSESEHWKNHFQQHRQKLQQQCRILQSHWMEIATDAPLIEAVQTGLRPARRSH